MNIRPIFQHFLNRLGTARLSRVGTLEIQAGDFVLNLDVYPVSNPDDPSKIVILPDAGLLAAEQQRELARSETGELAKEAKERKSRPIEVRSLYLHFIARPGNDGLIRMGMLERFSNGSANIILDAIPSRAPDSSQANAFRIIAPAGGGEQRAAASANMAQAQGAQSVRDEDVALARHVG
jgi:hypothetical protein